MLIPPLLILAGFALKKIFRAWLESSYKIRTQLLGLAIIVSLTLIPTIVKYRTYVSVSPWDAQVEAGPRSVREFFLEKVIPQLPKDSLFIHSLTGLTLMKGLAGMYYEILFSNDQAVSFIEEYLKAGKPVYIYQTYICETSPKKCEKFENLFKFTIIKINDAENYPFDVAKIELK
jgi:hypothetical protein